MKVKYFDIFDGIIGYLFLIISIGILLYVYPRKDSIKAYSFVLLVTGSVLDIALTIFWTAYFTIWVDNIKQYIKM